MAINLGARWFPGLETNPPTYLRVSSERTDDGREITKYVLANGRVDTITRAEALIRDFVLANFGRLCACFPLEGLRERIIRKPYVTINGQAICLSQGRTGGYVGHDRDYGDKYFSDGWLKRPIRCTQGHLLEQQTALCWIERRGDFCPVLPPHAIGNVLVDNALAQEIENFRESDRQLQGLYRPRPEDKIPPATEVLGKTFLKTVTKIPGLSLGFGVAVGGIRAAKGQWWRAGGEVLSGVAACYPGMGTGLSFALDGCIAARDILGPSGENDRLRHAYEILGIDLVQNPDPLLFEVETAWRQYRQNLFDLDLERQADGARDYIYDRRGWFR